MLYSYLSYSYSLVEKRVVMVVLKETIIDYCACYMPLIKDCVTVLSSMLLMLVVKKK